jgi:hypothetical protein
MKNLFKSIAALIILVSILSSCKKEEYCPTRRVEVPIPRELIQTGLWFIVPQGADTAAYQIKVWSPEMNLHGDPIPGFVWDGGLALPLYSGYLISIDYLAADSSIVSIVKEGSNIGGSNYTDTIPATVLQ